MKPQAIETVVESKAHSFELDKLVGLFFDDLNQVGVFKPKNADAIPEPQRSLLNHEFHMTVTVEKFHSSPVDVIVKQESTTKNFYSREICLQTISSRQIVQYGIVRLNFSHLGGDVRDEILGKSKPLGRVLIEHDVLRRVKLLSLYEVIPADYLKSQFETDRDVVFGRTAIIYCNEEPAIELLEIVTA